MSDQLDTISAAIGGLQADVQNILRSQDHLVSYIKDNNDKIANALKEHNQDDERRFHTVEKSLVELQTFKNRVYGIAAFVSLIASVGSNLASSIVKKF